MHRYDVYLAGPFFNAEQKATMAKAKELLTTAGLKVCDPQDLSPVLVDLPPEQRTTELLHDIFMGNVTALAQSEFVVACIDGKDIGTAFEMGFFFACHGSRFIYTFSASGKDTNIMLSQSTAGHASSWLEFPSMVEAMIDRRPMKVQKAPSSH